MASTTGGRMRSSRKAVVAVGISLIFAPSSGSTAVDKKQQIANTVHRASVRHYVARLDWGEITAERLRAVSSGELSLNLCHPEAVLNPIRASIRVNSASGQEIDSATISGNWTFPSITGEVSRVAFADDLGTVIRRLNTATQERIRVMLELDISFDDARLSVDDLESCNFHVRVALPPLLSFEEAFPLRLAAGSLTTLESSPGAD